MKARDEPCQIIKHNDFITTNAILFVWHWTLCSITPPHSK